MVKQKTINLYSFEELSEEARLKALEEHNKNNDYPFLEDDLRFNLIEALKENKIDFEPSDLKLLYSLSYCQGDGLCFIGSFEYKNQAIYINHNNRYYHKNSVDFSYTNNENEEDIEHDLIEEIFKEFQEIYFSICDKLEDLGYKHIEYEQSEENFKELCELNEYTFKENGEMENL